MVNFPKTNNIRLKTKVIQKTCCTSVLCILFIGCAVAPKKLFLKDVSKSFPEGTIISAATGHPVSFDELMSDLSGARVIYIGEKHRDPNHHQIQVKIIKEIFKVQPNTAVGLEMVDHTYQQVLDQWSEGILSQPSFLEKVHWYANWRFDYELYQNIFSFIKENNIRVVGLNIPFHIPPKIRLGGIENLSDDDKRYLPRNIDTTNKLHRDYVEPTFKQHQSMNQEIFPNFEYFYLAQCVWEDAMAENIADNLGGDVMVVLAGNGHIVYKFGIPDRAFSRTNAAFKTIYLASAGSQAEMSYADYIWVTPLKTKSH